jgi:3-hydroxyacyl-CoA dehydrogenase
MRLIPGWGGCTQMLLRHRGNSAAVFGLISKVKIARSAKEAMQLKFMRLETDGISIDRVHVARDLLLADARQRCLDMIAAGYTPPEKQTIRLPGEKGAVPPDKMLALAMVVNQVTDYDRVVWKALIDVLRGGKEGGEFTEERLHALERKAFMELIKNSETQRRIGNYLAHKPVKESGGGFAHRVIASINYLRGR